MQELHNVASTNPRVVASLKMLLSQEVNVEEADKMCKAYNLKQFEKYFYTPCKLVPSILSSTSCLYIIIDCLLACAYS